MTEKSPLRGTLINKIQAARAAASVEPEPTLKPESKLKGTLAEKIRAKSSSPEGVVVSKEEFPDENSLEKLMGKTVVQRDGGEHFTLTRIFEDRSRKLLNLASNSSKRVITIGTDTLLRNITTEGGAWRVLR